MVTSPQDAKQLRTWRLVHVLALLGFVSGVYCLAALVYFSATDRAPSLDLPVAIRFVLALGFFALFWLWVRMLVDFFKLRPSRFPVLWGWLLLLGSVCGAMLYFWLVWRPRNAPSDT